MYRRALLAVTALLAAGTRGGPRRAAAQEATPAAEPEVVIVDAVPEYQVVEVVDRMPSPPATLSLSRYRIGPGQQAEVFGERELGPVILVEAGSLTARASDPVTVTRGGPGGSRQEIAADRDFDAAAGDYFVGATFTTVVRNPGDQPLALRVFRLSDPAGNGVAAVWDGDQKVNSKGLATIATDAIPPAPALIELIRFTFAPGGYVELPATSPATALIVVETGAMTVTMGAAAVVYRSVPSGDEPVTDDYPAGTEFTIAAGQSMLGQPYAAVSARNDGAEPLEIYMAVVQPAPTP